MYVPVLRFYISVFSFIFMWRFNLILDLKSKKVGQYKKIDDERENKFDDYSSEFSTEGSVNARPNGKVHTWGEFSRHDLLMVHY